MTNAVPVTRRPIRFAIGSREGLSSHSRRVWTTKAGDAYLKCRDTIAEMKVSLHTSGRWRLAITREAIEQGRIAIGLNENRAWDIWDKPSGPVAVAYRLYFLTSELAVRPEDRSSAEWNEVIFIEPGPPGLLTAVSLFVTQGLILGKHENQPSAILACMPLLGDTYLQLIAHGEFEQTALDLVKASAARARSDAVAKGITVPDDAYIYFFGKNGDESRFLVGARIFSQRTGGAQEPTG